MRDSLLVTWETLSRFVAHLSYRVLIDGGSRQIVCLRGVELVAAEPEDTVGAVRLRLIPNVPDKYNDLVLVMGTEHSGHRFIEPYKATTEPGHYYTVTDPNPQGAAHLTDGEHLYHMGLHRSRPALRSMDEINRVFRDKDKNFKFSVHEQVHVGVFGINIHAGGSRESIGRNSAGCVTIVGGWSGKPWLNFMGQMQTHFKANAYIRVVNWSARDLFQWAKEGSGFHPTLFPGSQGPWITTLQGMLVSAGASIRPDGDWRDKTTNAVLDFQNRSGLVADGIVGKKTWNMLYA